MFEHYHSLYLQFLFGIAGLFCAFTTRYDDRPPPCDACSPAHLCCLSPTQILLFDQENFQGRMVEVQNECMNVCDHGMDRVRSIIVESGP